MDNFWQNSEKGTFNSVFFYKKYPGFLGKYTKIARKRVYFYVFPGKRLGLSDYYLAEGASTPRYRGSVSLLPDVNYTCYNTEKGAKLALKSRFL